MFEVLKILPYILVCGRYLALLTFASKYIENCVQPSSAVIAVMNGRIHKICIFESHLVKTFIFSVVKSTMAKSSKVY